MPAPDLLRALAAVLVVLCHTAESVYSLTPAGIKAAGPLQAVFAVTMFTLGRLGVPVFLFLTGYLLLGREYDPPRRRRFFVHNFLGLLLTTEIWVALYDAFLGLQSGEFDLLSFALDFAVEQDVALEHFWYMPMILTLYLVLPQAAGLLQKVKTKHLAVGTGAAAVCLLVIPQAAVVIGAAMPAGEGGGIALPGDIAPSALFMILFYAGKYGNYAVLLCLGDLVRRGFFRSLPAPALLAAGALSLAATVGLQLLCFSLGSEATVWYNYATLILCALCLFELLMRCRRVPCWGLFYDISRCAFGIYLVHYPLVKLAEEYIPLFGPQPLQLVCRCVLIFLISWALVSTVSANRNAGKLFFFIR